MITIREGEPGGGKTLSAVGEDILDALRKRRRIVTNINLQVDDLSELVGFDVKPWVDLRLDDDKDGSQWFSKAQHYAEHEDWRSEGDTGVGALIVVDEAHEVLRVQGYANKADDEVVNWFAKHRHKGTDVTLISQSFTAIPAQIRARVARRFWYRKLSFLGMPGRYVKKTFIGQSKQAVRTEYGRYPSSWFKLYRSTDAGIIESLPPEKNILFNWKLLLFVALLVIMLVYFLTSGGPQVGFPGTGHKASPAAQETTAAAPTEHKAEPVQEEVSRRVRGGLFGSEQAVEPSAELIQVQDEIAILRARYELQALQNQRTPFDWLDGKALRIVGYMFVNGTAEYFLEVDGGGEGSTVRASDLIQYGLRLTAIDACNATLRGDRGVYRLACDLPAVIGTPEDPHRAGRLEVRAVTAGSEIEVGPEGFKKPTH